MRIIRTITMIIVTMVAAAGLLTGCAASNFPRLTHDVAYLNKAGKITKYEAALDGRGVVVYSHGYTSHDRVVRLRSSANAPVSYFLINLPSQQVAINGTDYPVSVSLGGASGAFVPDRATIDYFNRYVATSDSAQRLAHDGYIVDMMMPIFDHRLRMAALPAITLAPSEPVIPNDNPLVANKWTAGDSAWTAYVQIEAEQGISVGTGNESPQLHYVFGCIKNMPTVVDQVAVLKAANKLVPTHFVVTGVRASTITANTPQPCDIADSSGVSVFH